MSNKLSDLVIANGDISVKGGRLELVQGETQVGFSITRRIRTPVPVYRKTYIDQGQKVQVADSSYGNPVYELLSNPNSVVSVQARESLIKLLSSDDRIILHQVEVTSTDAPKGEVNIQIEYQVKGSEYKEVLIV